MVRKTRMTKHAAYLRKWGKKVAKLIADEQCVRLAEYAKEKIQEIGAEIQTYNSINHMDRTGNLLDSLCWGVSYDGKLMDSGFYRGQSATRDSYLHEWMRGDVKYLTPVNGHQLAQDYVSKYGNNGTKGFRVFFAVLAPYWGYWEKGFTLKSYFGNTSQFRQFSVMTQFYDVVKADLKPMRVRFRVSVPKYDAATLNRRWEKYANKGR